jgi:hypothetical protein
MPAKPRRSYSRLSRYDETGLIWLLEGREVVALTEDTAAIRSPTGDRPVIYRRFNKPALDPLGDCIDDIDACPGWRTRSEHPFPHLPVR